MKGISVCSLAFLIILAIPLVAVSVANEEPPINHPQNPNRNLFSEVEVQGDVPIPDDPTIVRTRLVNVNFDLLGNTAFPAKTVRLNLFDSVVFTAVFDRTETNSLGSYAWIGHLEGIEFGQAVLVVTHGLLAGSVSMPGAIYQIHSIGQGIQVIDEIDQSTFPPEMDPIPAPPTEGNPFDDPEADDACNEITVLVAYTPAARAAEGGTAAIEARIALAVSETNQSYVNSGLTQRINLVHVMETNPGDAANNFSADLSALQNTTDGIFDNVDAARETHYADMVGLIIENFSSCGLGYLNSTAGWAFSVTHRTCATGYYSFGHELGHNMSARHDWYIDSSLNSPYSYSKAFVYINDPTRWRTIMAYNSLCSDTSPNTYCTRLQYWSNPNVLYGGISMGVQSDGPTNCLAGFTTPHPSTCAADNRMALNNTCSSVANFRQSPSTAPDMVVIDPSVSDSTLTPGQTFTIYATAENQGTGTSSGTTLRYYRSTDATISTGDTQIGTDVVDSLPAGGTSLENIMVSAPATDGTYYVGACVDGVSGESNTDNQCSSGVQITVSTPIAPDMVVIDPSVSDSTLTPGQTFTIYATAENQGTGTSSGTTLRYYRSTDATISTGDTQIGTDVVDSLPAGGTSLENIMVSAPATDGTYYVGACVDGVSGESNTDNQCSSGVQITVSTPIAPDMVVIDPSVSDSTLTPGQTFTIYATAENQGTGTSSGTTLRYYRSTDATISTGDTQIGTDVVDSLPAGGTSLENIMVSAPATDGTYYVGACVDGVSGESNTDNQCSSGVQITVSTPIAPDMVVIDPSVSDSTLTPGQTFTIYATVMNQGTGMSPSTTLEWHLSTDSTIEQADTLLGTDPVSSLSAGGTSPENNGVSAPSTDGIYWVGACVEAVSDESNMNNQCSSGVQITVGPLPAPTIPAIKILLLHDE